MNLSLRHEIDLIVDCGGDPTGTVDAAAAFNKAYAILSALAAGNSGAFPEVQQTLTLRIPPGYFRLTSVPTLWDFLSGSKGTSVQIIGSGDSSIIGHDGGGGIAIAANRITITDIAHWGTNLGIVANTGTCLNLNAEAIFTVERVHIFNVYAAIACIYLSGYGGTLRDVEVNQCCVLNPGQGCIYSNGVTLLKLDNVICHDVGQLNGQVGQAKTSFGNVCWIRHDDSNDISQGGRNQLIELVGCATSAGSYNGVILHGGATAARSLGFVRVVGFRSEPSSLGNTGAVLDVANTDRLEVHGFTDGGVAPGEGGNAIPAIKLVGVGHADIRGIQVQYDTANPPDALSHFITADNTCGIVEVYDAKSSPLGTTVEVRSSAHRTVSNWLNSSGGVYVSVTSGDDVKGNGAADAPFATIGAALTAIERASTQIGADVFSSIYIEQGDYPESPITLPGYISLVGQDQDFLPVLAGTLALGGGFAGGISLSNLEFSAAQSVDWHALGSSATFGATNCIFDDALTVLGDTGVGSGVSLYRCTLDDALSCTDIANADSHGSEYFGLATYTATHVNGALDSTSDVYKGGLTLVAAGGKTFAGAMAGTVEATLTLDGAGVSYTGAYADIPENVTLSNSAPAALSKGHGGFSQVFTGTTDVTGTPTLVASFSLPNGPFNGSLIITGRLVTPGVGGGVAGDIACQQYLNVVKVVGGVASLYAAVATLSSVDASILGTTFTAGVAGADETFTINTTGAGTGAGGIIAWKVTIDGKTV